MPIRAANEPASGGRPPGGCAPGAAGPPCAGPPADGNGTPPAGRPAGDVKRTVARNVLCNWAGTAVHMACGFITVPYLLGELGQEGYSLWTLIASLTGYFDLLDLGLRGSLGRNIAFQHAHGDRAGVRAVFNTGLALLSGGAALVLTGTAVVVLIFTDLFAVPPEQVAETRLALALIGLNLALVFLFYAFEGVLWAYQRFDLLNAVEIPGVLARTALTFALVTGEGGLVTLAVITLSITLASGATKITLAQLVAPDLRPRPGDVCRAAARGLYSFGVWCVLVNVARVVTFRAGEPIIGNRLGVALVAPFSVAARLVSYANTVLLTATGVLTPVATALHARGRYTQQQALFVQGGKFCFALGLFFLGLYAFLGGPLLELWTHGRLPLAAPVLLVLILGEVLPMSQWVTYCMVLGMNRHRPWACMGLLEAASVISLALTVGQAHGLVGVAVTVAVPAAVFRGLVPMVYACRILGVPLWRYAAQALAPALATVAVPAAGLALVTAWSAPANWFALVGYAAAYGVAFLLAAGVVLVGVGQVKAHGGALVRSLVGARGA
jgi:O-antigen/teichoic acid export membrane protein